MRLLRKNTNSQLPTHFYMKTLIAFVSFVCFCGPLTAISAAAPFLEQNAARSGRQDWQPYVNEREGYAVRLPAHLKVNFTKQNEKQWAVRNRMPYDYVNFVPRQEDDAVPFELGIGVHLNRDALDTRDFADKKDEGLRLGGARIEMLRQSEITVCGIKGVRDDFRIRQPDGWRSYARVIIPRRDTFIVFLGTLGNERPVPEYEDIFNGIIAEAVTLK